MALEANERQTGVDRRQLSSYYRSYALAPIFFSAVALRLQTDGWVCTIVCACIRIGRPGALRHGYSGQESQSGP
jgi:hypothetical protein